jgi:hypothetical protein
MRTPFPPRRAAAVLFAAVSCAASAGHAHAQLRGLPVFFDPTDSYDTRVGIDAGHWGEAGGTAAAVTATHLFRAGNCRRYALSAGAGALNPAGGATDAFPMAGALGSVLLNPCPRPTSVSPLTVRAFAGAGAVRVHGRTAADVPLGVGAGYVLPFAAVRIEPWITPRAEYRQALSPVAPDRWDFAVSAGVDLGSGALLGRGWGARIAVDCCRGGASLGYGISRWF